MKRERVEDILRGKVPVGTECEVCGWVRTLRESKAGMAFLHMTDGSTVPPLQVLAKPELPNYASEVLRLSAGCSLIARGVIVASQGKGQAVELEAREIEVVGWVEDPETYPIQPKRHTPEFLRDVAHLRPRTNLIGAVARVRNSLAQAIHRFFHGRDFYWIHTPIITGNDAEGAGAMFRVSTLDLVNLPRTEAGAVDFSQDFFGRETHLTVSGQLNVECYCMALSRVYTFGPTFRAENSNTRRHLAEFWMIEPEIAFGGLSENVALAEDFLKYIFRAVLDERPEEMALFAQHVDPGCQKRVEAFVNAPFEQMHYTEAVRVLEKSGHAFEFPVHWGMDLQSEHERFLTEEIVGRPVVVKNYPKEIKAFYMRMNEDGQTVAAMDVLAPGIGEIIGGSQREERLDMLDRRLAEMKLDLGDYGWYRDLRRYGTVPHAGFGLGFERALMYVSGIDNIREAIPFPRWPRNARF